MRIMKKIGRRAGFTWLDWAIVLATLVVAVVAIPNFVPARTCTSPSSCIANLKQLEGAKATWALEYHKAQTDTPTDADLFGSNAYIRVKPVCPSGGTYTLGTVGENPKCSFAGHTLPP